MAVVSTRRSKMPGTSPYASKAIFTDANGRPIPRPEREEFTSVVEFLRAVHEYNETIRSQASKAFDEAFRNAMRFT